MFERTMNVAWSQTTRQRPDSTSTNEASSQVVPAPPGRRMTCLWTSLSCFPRNWPTRCQRRTSKQLLLYGTKIPSCPRSFPQLSTSCSSGVLFCACLLTVKLLRVHLLFCAHLLLLLRINVLFCVREWSSSAKALHVLYILHNHTVNISFCVIVWYVSGLIKP